MELSNKTKKQIESITGLSIEEINAMDISEENRYVEKKIGKSLSWREGLSVEGRPIRTMPKVDKRIEEITR